MRECSRRPIPLQIPGPRTFLHGSIRKRIDSALWPSARHQRRARRAHRPHRRHSRLRPRCPQLRRVRPRGRAHAADSAGPAGRALHRARSARRSWSCCSSSTSATGRPSTPIPRAAARTPWPAQNLGEGAGLLAAAALMIDYMLTAAVGISAGVGALISAVPSLQPHTLQLCLGVLAHSHHRQHARRPRHRRGVHDSHLPVHRHAAHRDRGGRLACASAREGTLIR